MDKIIMVKSPFRISLAGGGTDVYSYCKKYGGLVIGFSNNKYVILTLRANEFYRCNEVIVNKKIDIFKNDDEINNKYLKEASSLSPIQTFYKMNVLSDIPEQSGLGGSAAFLNSIIYARNILNCDLISKTELAEMSSSVEIEKMHRSVGKQDHYLSSVGGMNFLKFDTNMNTVCEQIPVGKKCREYLKNRLLLFYTNISRSAGEILNVQDTKIKNSDQSTIELMEEIKSLVDPMYQAIIKDEPDKIGPLLAKHWEKKHKLSSKVTNSKLESLIDICYKNGADGCKILGAGGGGFILVSVKKGYVEQLRSIMKKLNINELEFDIEFDGTTSKII